MSMFLVVTSFDIITSDYGSIRPHHMQTKSEDLTKQHGYGSMTLMVHLHLHLHV